MEAGEMVQREKIEMLVGRWEVRLISGRSLDFELWDVGLVRLCQWSALPSGQYGDVVGSLGSVMVPGTM